MNTFVNVLLFQVIFCWQCNLRKSNQFRMKARKLKVAFRITKKKFFSFLTLKKPNPTELRIYSHNLFQILLHVLYFLLNVHLKYAKSKYCMEYPCSCKGIEQSNYVAFNLVAKAMI